MSISKTTGMIKRNSQLISHSFKSNTTPRRSMDQVKHYNSIQKDSISKNFGLSQQKINRSVSKSKQKSNTLKTGIKFFDIQYQRISEIKKKYLGGEQNKCYGLISYPSFSQNQCNSNNKQKQIQQKKQLQNQTNNKRNQQTLPKSKILNQRIIRQYNVKTKQKQNQRCDTPSFRCQNQRLNDYFKKMEQKIDQIILPLYKQNTCNNNNKQNKQLAISIIDKIEDKKYQFLPKTPKTPRQKQQKTKLIVSKIIDYQSQEPNKGGSQKTKIIKNKQLNLKKFYNEEPQISQQKTKNCNRRDIETQRAFYRINEINEQIETKVKNLYSNLQQKQLSIKEYSHSINYKDQQISYFLQNIEQQIALDIKFRKLRQCIPKTQLEYISKTINKINPKITKQKLMLQNNQLNPFEEKKQNKFNISKQKLISELIQSYQQAEAYFNQFLLNKHEKDIINVWLNQVDNSNEGLITIGNITTFINLRTGKDYRNRDLVKFLGRINDKKQFNRVEFESIFAKHNIE